jgi:hypothetical protein
VYYVCHGSQFSKYHIHVILYFFCQHVLALKQVKSGRCYLVNTKETESDIERLFDNVSQIDLCIPPTPPPKVIINISVRKGGLSRF